MHSRFMTAPENLVYLADTENRPTPEDMPEGTYKYVFDGESRGVIFARIQPSVPDHPVLQRVLSPLRLFDPRLDDAGRFGLRWQESEEEMAVQVEEWEEKFKKEGEPFDSAAYLEQLRTNFGQTQIRLDSKYGSTKLEYPPNSTTRSNFTERLQQLFPEAQIIFE